MCYLLSVGKWKSKQSCDHETKVSDLKSNEVQFLRSWSCSLDKGLCSRTIPRSWLDSVARLLKICIHIAVFKSRLCCAWHFAVFSNFSSSVQSWLHHGRPLILIWQQLMLIICMYVGLMSAVGSRDRCWYALLTYQPVKLVVHENLFNVNFWSWLVDFF